MDVTGLLKKSYQSYGTFFSDDFLAFLKQTSENHVSQYQYRFFSFVVIKI